MREAADAQKITSWKDVILLAEDTTSIGLISKGDYEERGMQAIKALGLAFDYVREHAALRETWREDEVMISSMWTGISSLSTTTQCRYELGFGHGVLKLQTSLRHACNVRNMKNEFWTEFTKLFSFGEVQYEKCGVPMERLRG